MRDGKLEELIRRAMISYLADKVLERLGYASTAPHLPCPPVAEKKFPGVAPARAEHSPRAHAKQLFSRADALSCQPGVLLRLERHTLLTPLAADELARRRVRIVRT
jgi:hypothetical protein